MKIDEVVVGEEYAFEAPWRYVRRRVRAAAIERVPNGPYKNARQVRKVRIEVLDWDTGEPTPDDPKNNKHVEARRLEPFGVVRDRIEAMERRDREDRELTARILTALQHAGVKDAGVMTRPGRVAVYVSRDNVEELLAALQER